MDEQVVEIVTSVDADTATVWKAMTNSKSPMFMGATMDTDWSPGSQYKLHGEWGGKPFEDFGEIEVADAPKELSFTHWSKTEQRPESYNALRFRVERDGDGSKVTLTQFARGKAKSYDDKTKAEFKKTYGMMLDGLKTAAEAT
ncbi:MAG: SRPBCC domain-containing protein [Devosia sp.]